jgi:hypothetical protein
VHHGSAAWLRLTAALVDTGAFFVAALGALPVAAPWLQRPPDPPPPGSPQSAFPGPFPLRPAPPLPQSPLPWPLRLTCPHYFPSLFLHKPVFRLSFLYSPVYSPPPSAAAVRDRQPVGTCPVMGTCSVSWAPSSPGPSGRPIKHISTPFTSFLRL